MVEADRLTRPAHATVPGGHLEWLDAWRWALDVRQTFAGLLEVGARMAALEIAEPGGAGDGEHGGVELNLCLLTSALHQILSDHLHRHFYDLDPLSVPLGSVRRLARPLFGAPVAARRAWVRTRRQDLVAFEAELAEIEVELAGAHLGAASEPGAAAARRRRVASLAGRSFPDTLLRWRLKVPGAFRSMDLYPEDCALIARRAAAAVAEPGVPVIVAGVRTSGVYMAPFAAAALRAAGTGPVSMISIRPGVPLLHHEQAAVRRAARAGAWALVLDDPTWWGTAYARSTAALAGAGFAPARIWSGVCEIGNQPALRLLECPDDLLADERARVWAGFAAAPKVLLRRGEWEVDRLLESGSLEATLNRPRFREALAADSVRVIARRADGSAGREPAEADGPGSEPAPPRRQGRRFHARAVVDLEVARGSRRERVRVLAKGAGVGFFGLHALLAAEALPEFVPRVLGLDRGILFSEWVEGDHPIGSDLALARRMGRYVAARASGLALSDSPPPVYEGRAVLTAARRSARVLARGLGRTGAIAQFRIEEELRPLLASPAVAVDGQMRPSEWLVAPGREAVKVDFEEHGFDITDRCVVDPLLDVALAVASFGLEGAHERALLAAAGDLGRGTRERLLVYKLAVGSESLDSLHIELADHDTPEARARYAGRLAAAEDLLSGAVNGYLAEALPQPLGAARGQVWAVDLDDTLETDRLGFPAGSPAGVRGLRLLQGDGASVVLASGRSLEEVRERCRTFGLPGGVAEYGAVAWDAEHGTQLDVIGAQALLDLDRLRASLAVHDGLLIDPRYRHSLRVFRHGARGRQGVDARLVLDAIERLGIKGLTVTRGWRKTVVQAAGIGKADGLLRLLGSLELGAAVDHAAGDSITDLEVLASARHRHAPANAGSELRRRRQELALTIESRPYQAGFLQAVERSLRRRGRRVESPTPAGAMEALLALQDLDRGDRLRFLAHPASARFAEF